MGLLPTDFKSVVYAYSTTRPPAEYKEVYHAEEEKGTGGGTRI